MRTHHILDSHLYLVAEESETPKNTLLPLHIMSDKPVTDQAKDAAQGAKEGVAGEGTSCC